MIDELGFWPRFVLAVLATWRVSHFLAKEDGPNDLVVRLRAQLGEGFLGRLMDCVYCLSLWIAAPFSLYVSQRPLDLLPTWLAISGAACLLDRVGQEPVMIQPLTRPEGGVDDGMLRSESSSTQQHAVADESADGNPPRTD